LRGKMFKKLLPITLTEAGFAPVVLLVLLMFGIAAGTILVQNGVNFIPKAADEQEALRPVDPKKLKECDSKENADDIQKCKDEVCAADEVTYCDNRESRPRAIRKQGGYYDPNHPLQDGSGCVFDFFEVSEKNDQCAKSNSKNGDVVYTTKEEGEQIDNRRKNSLKDREKADKCKSKVECRKNGDKLEAWRIISTYDDENGKPENNFCIGAKIEGGRLVADYNVASFEFRDSDKDGGCKGKNDKDVIEQSSSGSQTKKEDLATSSDRGRFGVDTDAQTRTLQGFLAKAKASASKLTPEQRTLLNQKIDKAEKELAKAKGLIDECIKTGAQTDCANALAAQIYAIALSREVLAEAIALGVESDDPKNPLRVKTDLQIGDNNNTLITAKPAASTGKTGYGRVFARAAGGKIYFEVRADDGSLVIADDADLRSAGLRQGMTTDEYSAWMQKRLETVRQTTKQPPVLTPGSGPASAEWKQVDKQQCYDKCGASFPRDALCFFNQSKNLYNCSRDTGAYCESNAWCSSDYCDLASKTCQIKPTAPQARQSECGFPESVELANQETCRSGFTLTYCTNGGGFRCYPNGTDPKTYKPVSQNKPTDLKSLVIDPNNKNCNQGCTFKYPNTASSYRQNEGAITVSIGQGVADGYRLTAVCRIKKDGSQVCLDTRNRLAGRFTPGIETPAGETITITTPAELDAFIKSKVSAYAEFVEKVFSE
jgi:hypothetical protein